MLFSSFFLIPIASIIALITMAIQRNHLLISLLALEIVILSITLTLPIFLTNYSNQNISITLLIITFGACEACVGLSCLVSLIRNKGNDLINSSSSNNC